MVIYRKFRNADPPLLTEVWNEALTGRGAVKLRNSSPFDRYILAKPYFDPAGLILALDNNRCVGFAHAGFVQDGGNHQGVIGVVAVRPGQRKQGIGSELLRQVEAYLAQRGATSITVGYPGLDNPFYLGIYGGAQSPGVLVSDPRAGPFLMHRGYSMQGQHLVLQVEVAAAVKVVDARFPVLRTRYQLRARTPKRLDNFALECTLGQLEPLEFYLDDTVTGALVARTFVWEMEGFSWRWGHPTLGLVGFEVMPEYRRQGLGKFLLLHMMRHFQEQYFEMVEMHAAETNSVALGFLQKFGFQTIDVGQVFSKTV